MSGILTINLSKAIISATIPGGGAASAHGLSDGTHPAENAAHSQSAQVANESRKASFLQINEALQGAVGKLNKFCEEVFVEHKEQIARLAVEIARKILARKVQEGDYEIESIVKEAINNAPVRQDIVVHLNPDDLAQYEQSREDAGGETLTGVRFVSDGNISRAECVLETPKGIIESVIEQHLDQVGKALKGVN